MILQYNTSNGEFYQESQSIFLCELSLSELNEKTKENVLDLIYNEVTKSKVLIDCDDIFENEKLNDCNKIKIAVLSDGKERENNLVLIFGENTEVYLLNNSGKTIRKL